MDRFPRFAYVVLGGLTLCAAVYGRQGTSSSPAAAPARYEYKIVVVSAGDADRMTDGLDYEMKRLGVVGWEMVTSAGVTTQLGKSGVAYTFRRPK